MVSPMCEKNVRKGKSKGKTWHRNGVRSKSKGRKMYGKRKKQIVFTYTIDYLLKVREQFW
jgi:hypothetical protein